jgi:SnoaL-like domain
MEPSPEMANVLARLLDAIRDGDERAVSNRFSRQPGFERYGSDPAEHWRDGDEAVLVLIQQIRETGGFPWRRVGDVHAMSEGTVGWASGEMEFETALGAVPYRVCCVLHLEHGEWKIVQWLSAVPAFFRRCARRSFGLGPVPTRDSRRPPASPTTTLDEQLVHDEPG